MKRRCTIDNNNVSNINIYRNKKVIIYNIKNVVENSIIDNGPEKLVKTFTLKIKIKLNKSKSSNLIFIKNNR